MTLAQQAAITHAGRKRRRNEDAYVCEPPLFAVADGMGGAQAGQIASKVAAAALSAANHEAAPPEQRVVALIQEANRRVYERAAADEAAAGMGTTMTVALLEHGRVWIGHVGDSRAYLIRDRRLEQLTEDHSLVAELVRSGKLSPEEAEAHPQRSVITRALGTDPDVDVDTFSVRARPGDVFMLCSDGLTSMVDDATILDTVEKHLGDLKKAAKALVDAANRGGGEDNITIVFFEIGEAIDDTAQIAPPAAEGGRDTSEEDTLSGLEPVPPIDVEERWPETEAKPRSRWRSAPVLAAAALGLVAIVAAAVLFGLSRSYFVGTEPNGRVAVYQGVPWDLFGGVKLYRLRYESHLLAVQLSQPERGALFDHDLQGYEKALAEVKKYEQDVVP